MIRKKSSCLKQTRNNKPQEYITLYILYNTYNIYYVYIYKNIYNIAAITNHHTFNSLKQQKDIILQFWLSEVQNQYHGDKSMLSEDLVPSSL